jgi:[ribosomal protein S5]-alanine N-acetyltransferase
MIWWPSEVPTITRGLITLRKPHLDDTQAVFDGCQDPSFLDLPQSAPIIQWRMPLIMCSELMHLYVHNANYHSLLSTEMVMTKSLLEPSLSHSLSVKNSVGELGYWMTSSMRGKGIATTAARMLTDYGFASIGFKRVEALVDIENVASAKLLESAGYQREGLLKNKVTRADGRQVDMYLFAAVPQTWEFLPD